MNNLGNILSTLGDPKGAWSAYVCALAILEHVLGPDHPDVATQHNRIGIVLQKLDDLEGAQAAFERALRILEELFPTGHPHVKAVQENLDILATIKDRAILARLSLHQIPIGGPNRFYVCPECGAVREEAQDESGTTKVRYHGLNSDTLSKIVVEKARAILERLKPEQLRLLDADRK
jgi:tetratricopeptide (TPR) repeat protein